MTSRRSRTGESRDLFYGQKFLIICETSNLNKNKEAVNTIKKKKEKCNPSRGVKLVKLDNEKKVNKQSRCLQWQEELYTSSSSWRKFERRGPRGCCPSGIAIAWLAVVVAVHCPCFVHIVYL